MALNKFWVIRNKAFAEQTSICTLFPIPSPGRLATTEVLGGPPLLGTRIPLRLGLLGDACPSLCPEVPINVDCLLLPAASPLLFLFVTQDFS